MSRSRQASQNRGADGHRDGAARRRMGTVFGWIAGGSLGVLSSYSAFLLMGGSYPVVPATFAAFVAGAFGGMWLADRLGERAFRWLGLAAGLLLALTLTVLVGVLALAGPAAP